MLKVYTEEKMKMSTCEIENVDQYKQRQHDDFTQKKDTEILVSDELNQKYEMIHSDSRSFYENSNKKNVDVK